MIPGVNCGTCLFYSPSFRNPATGQCRAHAPVLMMTERGSATQWPLTSATTGWCGDHATIEEEQDG
jgi:hypothetical protein